MATTDSVSIFAEGTFEEQVTQITARLLLYELNDALYRSKNSSTMSFEISQMKTELLSSSPFKRL